MNSLITLNKISKSFETNKKISVLKKINFKFNFGKIYSVVGPSGSGKSTLLNILSLIDKPSTGFIKIGENIINFSESAKNDKIRAEKIGIVYQQNNLLADFTALENVYLAKLSLLIPLLFIINAAGVVVSLSMLISKSLVSKLCLPLNNACVNAL